MKDWQHGPAVHWTQAATILGAACGNCGGRLRLVAMMTVSVQPIAFLTTVGPSRSSLGGGRDESSDTRDVGERVERWQDSGLTAAEFAREASVLDPAARLASRARPARRGGRLAP